MSEGVKKQVWCHVHLRVLNLSNRCTHTDTHTDTHTQTHTHTDDKLVLVPVVDWAVSTDLQAGPEETQVLFVLVVHLANVQSSREGALQRRGDDQPFVRFVGLSKVHSEW